MTKFHMTKLHMTKLHMIKRRLPHMTKNHTARGPIAHEKWLDCLPQLYTMCPSVLI
jgi:hypothetical protein